MTAEIARSARETDKVGCPACALVAASSEKRCPHCRRRLHSRKVQSDSRTWAYLLTAIFLFFPANLLPITYTRYLIEPVRADTIISSIVFLWQHGSRLIACVIFTTSIVTPLCKIAVLLYLLTRQAPRKPPLLPTRLYRIIHFIGRWSMVDVFVVALLGALIHGRLAQIDPGMGIFAFAGVVIFTMAATQTFDIRILWDNYRHHARSDH